MDAINDTMADFYNDTDLFSGEFWHPLLFPRILELRTLALPTNTNPSTWQSQGFLVALIYEKVSSGTPWCLLPTSISRLYLY